MTEGKWRTAAAITLTVAGAVLAFYLFFDILIGILLPFLLAFGVAALVHPFAHRFAARTRLPEKVVAAVFTLCFLMLLGAALYLLFAGLFAELQGIISGAFSEDQGFSAGLSHALDFLRDAFARLAEIPIFSRIFGVGSDPARLIEEQLQKWLMAAGDAIPALAASVVRALPGIIFFLVVVLIACFYFAIEYETVKRCLVEIMPKRLRERAPRIFGGAKGILLRCLRAYLFLFLITFAELLVGLLFLRVRYVLFSAFFIAILDILPIFGVGAALVPWAIFCFLVGDTARGIGLLVVWGIITVVRQVIEPHFVGKSLGLHPLLMLGAFYAGIRIFGVVGVFAGPLLAVLLKLAFDWKKRERDAQRVQGEEMPLSENKK